jgi:hypothetical protein
VEIVDITCLVGKIGANAELISLELLVLVGEIMDL